jgi:adenylate cyclase
MPSEDRPARSGKRVARLTQLALTVVVVTTNALAAALVFALAVFVIPSPEGVDSKENIIANAILTVAYLSFAIPLGVVWGTRRLRDIRPFLVEERAPEPGEQRLVLRGPFRLFRVQLVLWSAATLAFGTLNFTYSAELGVRVAIAVGLCGLTTCAVSYLLAERILRPIAARALATGTPERIRLPGVTLRALLAWALGTAVPILGLLAIGISTLADPEGTPRELGLAMVGLGGIALVVGLFAAVVAARATADPVRSVRKALAQVEKGDLDVEVPVYDGTEVGLLQAGFNRMVEGLRERERLHDLFGRHVGEDVARAALERGVELGGETRDVAVLFVDIVGSTSLAADKPPEEVVSLLNRFFDVVVEVVTEHGGSINKFEGDAALAIFGAPVELPDRHTKALAAARKLAERLRRDVPELEAGIGLSGGDAVAGNVGAAERFEYTVIGDAVNEAARLTELAKEVPSRVVASAELVDQADSSEAERWELGDEVTLRGRSRATRVATPR